MGSPVPFCYGKLKNSRLFSEKKFEAWDVGGIFELLPQINVQFHKYKQYYGIMSKLSDSKHYYFIPLFYLIKHAAV